MAQIKNVITVTLNPAIDRVLEVGNFQVGHHQKGNLLMRYPAGKAINVSRALAALGRKSIATGFVPHDHMEFYETFLKETCRSRVVCQFLAVRGRLRENITIVDPVLETETHIREEGSPITSDDFTRMQSKLQLLARPETVVCFSGSIPPGLGTDGFVKLVQCCQDAGARVVVDTNGPPLLAMRDMPIWMLKPNRQELAELIGKAIPTEADLYEAALKLTDRAKIVIVTAGADGAYIVTRRARYKGHVNVHPGLVQNTVGCGDCLLAGFLDAWIEGKSLDVSLRRALGTATANAADLGIATFDEQRVAEFETHTQVRPWTQ